MKRLHHGLDIAIIWCVTTLDVVSGAKAEVEKDYVRVHLCWSIEQGDDKCFRM